MKAMTLRAIFIFSLVLFSVPLKPVQGSIRANPSQISSDQQIQTGPTLESINTLLENALAIDAGGGHTCALTSSGGVQCWGYNGSGQLGDGTTTDRWTPVDTVGLWIGVTAISAGGFHTCVLTSSGGVKCWGDNGYGQLGDGTTTDRWTPVDVVGLGSGVMGISTGGYHTCALRQSGGVKCWGYNDDGQLGDGTNMGRITPVDVVGLGSGITVISAGGFHTCALRLSGGVKCWGYNYDGQVGDGTTTDRWTPVDVVGLASEVTAISAGGYHTCALTGSGGVKCWGYNYDGQLGDGTKTSRNIPVDVVGLASEVTAINAGGHHTSALMSNGGVKCWGYNGYGQLGDGTTTDRNTPVDVVGLSSEGTAVSAGDRHTCALASGGGMKCWGNNYAGELGDGMTYNRYTPTEVTGLSSGVMALSAGEEHTCALTSSGGVKCWGDNFYGQLGDGTMTGRWTPADVVCLASGVTAISSGGHHTCALTNSGGVKCWGNNYAGELGDGTNISRNTPVDVAGLASGATAISAGWEHTCALMSSGGVKCWGNNSHGQLGSGGDYVSSSKPVDVKDLASEVTAIRAGGGHTCALRSSGEVKCWGYNHSGQLGDGTTTDRKTPVDVVGLGSGVTAISAGGYHTCALRLSGGVKCWGYNYDGQVGDGTTTDRWTPVDVVGLASGVTAISAGGYHTCALRQSGGVKCWGYNGSGQLGDGTISERWTPVDVVGLASTVTAIGVGSYHTCALTSNGGVLCWGLNFSGQLGNGIAGYQPSPVDVVGFGLSRQIFLPMLMKGYLSR